MDGKSTFPPQIKFIVGNEGCERYSYYGMRSILVIYMIQYLLIDRVEATSTYHKFAAACYLLPLLGGFLADRVWGKYKTILYLSLVYCLGNIVLAFGQSLTALYIGLGLIALGSGGIKPCVSAYVGDQFTKGQEGALKKVFDLFYWMINFGSFFATLITPLTLKFLGPQWAFGIPAFLMFIAIIIFWAGRQQYVSLPPTGKQPHGLFSVLSSAFRNLLTRPRGAKFLDGALKDHPQEAIEGVKAVGSIAKLFLMVSVFWALFDQHGSTWILQAKEMNLNFFGIELLPAQIAALNPIMVMTMIPLFSFGVYPFLERMGFNITPLKKMGAGMLVAALSFVEVAVIQFFLDQGVQLSVAWQFFPYLTITAAEILISITGLEFAYTQAPRVMKSTIMSLWLLSVFVGNLFTAYIAEVNVFSGPAFFLFFAIMMFSVAIIFIIMAVNYKMRNYMEDKEHQEDSLTKVSVASPAYIDDFEKKPQTDPA